MPPRHLLSTRRRVPSARRPEYDAAWERLFRGATAAGAHAWRFVAAGRDDLYLEFLEFPADRDPRADLNVAAALAALNAFPEPPPAAEATEEWTEIRDST